jgi:assimilatory nitrate reductase catalytic subunit
VATPVREPAHQPTALRPLCLNTGRVRDQWHTMTRTGKSARLGGHRPEPTLELHFDDAVSRGLQDGDIACVESDWGSGVFVVRISDTLRPGGIFAPMHWTAQVSRAARINAAVTPATDPVSGQPELKHTPVEVRKVDVAWHGTILARRPVMLPDLSYWTHVTGLGFHVYLAAGTQPLAAARQSLSAAVRAANPGPWLEGETGIGVVIGDGRLEAALDVRERRDESARDRLMPFMHAERLSVEQRVMLLQGGVPTERGGEICACFGISRATVETAIHKGAESIDAVACATRAGSNCGSCRPEIRALLRGRRALQAA